MSTLNTDEGVALELRRRLMLIDGTGSFETEIGSKFYMGRRDLPEVNELPCVMLISGRDVPSERMVKTEIVKSQGYVVWAFDKCDADNPDTKAHAMLRDIKRAIWSDGNDFGRTVKSVNYEGRQFAARESGSKFVQVALALTVLFSEDLSKP